MQPFGQPDMAAALSVTVLGLNDTGKKDTTISQDMLVNG